MSEPMEKLPIDEIIIGERHRKDMGDIQGLADSMKEHGLLHPIVMKPDKTLVAGQRRIEAARLLGWKEIPATILDVADLLSAERDENEARKDFTPSEAVAIGRLIAGMSKNNPKSLETKTTVNNGRYGAGPHSAVASKVVGFGEDKYLRAKAVVEAAERDPAKYSDIVTKMDEGGNVNGAFREMKRRKAGHKPDPQFTGGRPKRRGTRSDKSAPYDPQTKRQQELAEGQKKRLVRALNEIHGHCRGFKDLDVQMAISRCEEREVKEWSNMARNMSRALAQLARKLVKNGG